MKTLHPPRSTSFTLMLTSSLTRIDVKKRNLSIISCSTSRIPGLPERIASDPTRSAIEEAAYDALGDAGRAFAWPVGRRTRTRRNRGVPCGPSIRISIQFQISHSCLRIRNHRSFRWCLAYNQISSGGIYFVLPLFGEIGFEVGHIKKRWEDWAFSWPCCCVGKVACYLTDNIIQWIRIQPI